MESVNVLVKEDWGVEICTQDEDMNAMFEELKAGVRNLRNQPMNISYAFKAFRDMPSYNTGSRRLFRNQIEDLWRVLIANVNLNASSDVEREQATFNNLVNTLLPQVFSELGPDAVAWAIERFEASQHTFNAPAIKTCCRYMAKLLELTSKYIVMDGEQQKKNRHEQAKALAAHGAQLEKTLSAEFDREMSEVKTELFTEIAIARTENNRLKTENKDLRADVEAGKVSNESLRVGLGNFQISNDELKKINELSSREIETLKLSIEYWKDKTDLEAERAERKYQARLTNEREDYEKELQSMDREYQRRLHEFNHSNEAKNTQRKEKLKRWYKEKKDGMITSFQAHVEKVEADKNQLRQAHEAERIRLQQTYEEALRRANTETAAAMTERDHRIQSLLEQGNLMSSKVEKQKDLLEKEKTNVSQLNGQVYHLEGKLSQCNELLSKLAIFQSPTQTQGKDLGEMKVKLEEADAKYQALLSTVTSTQKISEPVASTDSEMRLRDLEQKLQGLLSAAEQSKKPNEPVANKDAETKFHGTDPKDRNPFVETKEAQKYNQSPDNQKSTYVKKQGKTNKPCAYVNKPGGCRFGDQCNFAHNLEGVMCRIEAQTGSCSMKHRCVFAHR